MASLHPTDDETAGLLASIGGHLRRLRLKRGLTQEQAAEALGLAAKYLARVERGEVHIGVGTLVRFARYYDVDPGKLLREGPAAEIKMGRPAKKKS
jgi:transcriptional regulator with XRE-family HTH domain